MGQRLFISYSRRQTPFVDRLGRELENNGYSLWLDYKSLVPARPWAKQLEDAITEADAFLLIVSIDSTSSKYVNLEWKRALELNKRIILLIFEAVSLPEELQGREWVDLRTQYKQNFSQLIRILEKPNEVTAPPPQSGQKYPVLFWTAIALSVVLAVLCIPVWFTIIVPYLIFPLPWKIYKHNYVLSLLQPLLLFLPLINYLPRGLAFPGQAEFLIFLAHFAQDVSIPLWIISWLLLILLHFPVLQRVGHPEAALVRFSNFIKPPKETPPPVIFAIENAPEDQPYADVIRKRLEKLGHRLAVSNQEPQAIFVLVSIYKNSTTYDPDQQAVYPILLQDPSYIEESLSRIQWIDFRRGIRNLDKLARLLPQPDRLLKALAVVPMGNQRVYPFVVNFLQYFYILIGLLSWGGILNTIIFLSSKIFKTADRPQLLVEGLFLSLLSGFIQIGIVYLAVKGLRTRKGAGTSLFSLFLLTTWQAVLLAGNFYALLDPNYRGVDQDPYLFSAFLMPTTLMLNYRYAFLLLMITVLIQINQLVIYLPRHQYKCFDPVERWLLLYTPPGLIARVMQFMFHLILMLVFINFFMTPALIAVKGATFSGTLKCSWISILIALFLSGLVNHLTKKSTRSHV